MSAGGATHCPPGAHTAGGAHWSTEPQRCTQLPPAQANGAQSLVVPVASTAVWPSSAQVAPVTHWPEVSQRLPLAQSRSEAHTPRHPCGPHA